MTSFRFSNWGSLMFLGWNGLGATSRTFIPIRKSRRMPELATLELMISPTIAMVFPSMFPSKCSISVKRSSNACVGWAWFPAPALITGVICIFAKMLGASFFSWRIMTPSGSIAQRFAKVSSRLSPFLVEEREGSRCTTAAPRRLAATSNELRVRVEGSKNSVISSLSFSSCGGLCALNRFASSSRSVIWLLVKSFVSIRCCMGDHPLLFLCFVRESVLWKRL